MNFKSLALLILSSFLLFSCEEENHGVIFEKELIPLRDTSYISNDNIESVYKKVLIEDITGVRCANCPQAAEEAKRLKAKYGDTVVIMGIYLKSLPKYSSPYAGFPDLRTDEAEAIVSTVGKPQGIPHGYVDRFRFNYSPALVINQWEESYQTRRQLGNAPVKIELSSENEPDDIVVFRTKLTYTEDQSSETHKMALYITENDIISKQKTNEPSKPTIDDYSHQHVLRTSIGNPLGTRLSETLELGRVFEKDIEFKWNKTWDKSKCSLIVVVINESDESIVQVEELKLQ